MSTYTTINELLEHMEQSVKCYVTHYLSDYYDYDVPFLLGVSGAPGKYIWLLRECGTYLLDATNIHTVSAVLHNMENSAAYHISYQRNKWTIKRVSRAALITEYDAKEKELNKQEALAKLLSAC